MSTNSNNTGQIKRSLRNINNCFKIQNMFLNKDQQYMTQNIEFIPKHVRRKIINKQFLNCKDILDLEFKSQRPKVDLVTVKTAVRVQKNYQNIIRQRDEQKKQNEKLDRQLISSLKQSKSEQKESYRDLQSFKQPHRIVEQCVEHQIPTEKSIKKEIDP